MDVARPHAVRMLPRCTMEENRGPAAGIARYLNIAPAYALTPASAQRLHHRLFGGKARGVALCGIAMTFAVGDLAGRKNALEEDAAVPADHFSNPADFLNVHTQTDNHVILFSASPLLARTAIRSSGLYAAPAYFGPVGWISRRSSVYSRVTHHVTRHGVTSFVEIT